MADALLIPGVGLVESGSDALLLPGGGIVGPSTALVTLPTDLDAPSGWQVHNVTDISQAGDPDCIYYGASPSVASGDQLLVATTSGTYGRTITVDSQGLVSASAGGADTVAWYHWTDSNDTWSASKSYSLATSQVTLTCTTQSVAIAGSTTGLYAGRRLVGTTQGITLTGPTTTFTVTKVLTAQSQTVTLASQTVGLLRGLRIGIEASSIVLTGPPAGLHTAKVLSATSTSVTLTGTTTTLTVSAVLATLGVALDSPAGWQVHNVSDISQAGDTGCIYYGHSPAVAVGDQLLVATATTTNAWPITIDAQGFVEVDSGGSGGADSFGYYVFDETDDTWGTLGTFSLTAAWRLTATSAGVTLTGETATLTPQSQLTLEAQTASVTLTGQSATLASARTLTATSGSVTVAGASAGLSVARVLIAQTASVTLTGQSAGLTVARLLTAQTVSATLSGQSAGLTASRLLTAQTASVTLTGQSAGLTGGRQLTATTTAVTLTGQSAGLTVARLLTAQTADVTLTGQSAGLTASRVLTATTTAVTISYGATQLVTEGSIGVDFVADGATLTGELTTAIQMASGWSASATLTPALSTTVALVGAWSATVGVGFAPLTTDVQLALTLTAPVMLSVALSTNVQLALALGGSATLGGTLNATVHALGASLGASATLTAGISTTSVLACALIGSVRFVPTLGRDLGAIDTERHVHVGRDREVREVRGLYIYPEQRLLPSSDYERREGADPRDPSALNAAWGVNTPSYILDASYVRIRDAEGGFLEDTEGGGLRGTLSTHAGLDCTMDASLLWSPGVLTTTIALGAELTVSAELVGLMPTVAYSYSDDFNRAGPYLEAPWEVIEVSGAAVATNLYLSGGTLTNSVSNGILAARLSPSLHSFADDQWAETTVVVCNYDTIMSPMVRVDAEGAGYWVRVHPGLPLWIYGVGSPTSRYPQVGDVIRLEAVGTTISLYVNGVLVQAGTSSTYTAGQPGIHARYNASGWTPRSTVDNFNCSEVILGGP